jgi:hypothetical protein
VCEHERESKDGNSCELRPIRRPIEREIATSGCRGSTPSNVSPMHRPAPVLEVAGAGRRGACQSPLVLGVAERAGDGASGWQWPHRRRDRARPDRLAKGAVVARVLHVPERIDRRGGRSGQLGRGRHAECALVVRAGRRDRPPARTTTRTQPLPPWSFREGRVWRGVGVHRSCRVGLDWPVLPRPSPDLFLGAYRRFRCPAVR